MSKSDVTPSRSYLLDNKQSFDREVGRLRQQAEVLFRHEHAVLKNIGLRNPKSILELGCGNGQCLAQWRRQYPESVIFGMDRNADLLELAQAEIPAGIFSQGDLLNSQGIGEIVSRANPDTIIMRFVLQHLNEAECAEVMKNLRALSTKLRFQLILIDPDDSAITCSPPCPELMSAVKGVMRKQASRGGDRSRGARLEQFSKLAGFQTVSSSVIDLSSKSIGWDGVRSILVPLWKQGITEADGFLPIEQWISNGESNTVPSEIHSPVHAVIAI